jgi:hypothetical protein
MKLTQEDHHWLETYCQAFDHRLPGMVEHIILILFGAVRIRPGLIEAEWADVLAREQDRRLPADDSLYVSWDWEAAHDSSKLHRHLSSAFKNTSLASD